MTPAYAERLRRVVEACTPLLVALPDGATARRPAPEKWSPREILGHLIDSAANNHRSSRYAAAARGSIDMYRRRLRETREAIVRRRDEAPPLALGTRVGTSDQPEDYQLTIYLKGAWVLHMLRTILTDPVLAETRTEAWRD